MKKILTATDGSLPSERALMQAAEYASMWKATLDILTVIPEITPMASPIEGFPHQYMYRDRDKVEESYQKVLNYSVNKVKQVYSNLEINTHLKTGRPSEEIVKLAEELDSTLVVLGSRGIGGITGWILGSTCKKVVDKCRRQVLIVK